MAETLVMGIRFAPPLTILVRVQRLFSAFPSGWPSLGLLLLRAAIGASAIADAVVHLTGHADASPAVWVGGILAIACGVLLVFGFLTPIAGAVLAACIVTAPFFGEKRYALLVLVTSLAIVLLGPGALSIDARLFGRREIKF
jgi:uncharacterized membrane protein YphA (DoxX/SURF4 family)